MVSQFGPLNQYHRLVPNNEHRKAKQNCSQNGASIPYLFAVLSPGRVQALDEVGGVTKEQSVTRRTRDHREHC